MCIAMLGRNRHEHIEATGNFVPLRQKSQLQLGCLSTNMGVSKKHYVYIYTHLIYMSISYVQTRRHGSKEDIMYVCTYRTGMIYVHVHMYLVGPLAYRCRRKNTEGIVREVFVTLTISISDESRHQPSHYHSKGRVPPIQS
jgi:hypothetical protein